MNISTKPTTGKQLQQAINERLITVVNVKTSNKDTNEIQDITPQQFMTDLDFYTKAGIFADSLDFKYGIADRETSQVDIGYMSSYCNLCIRVALKLCGSVKLEDVTAQLINNEW